MSQFDPQIDLLDELARDTRDLEHRIMEAKGYLVPADAIRVYGDAAVQAQPDPRLASLAALDAEGRADDLRRSIEAAQRELSELATRTERRRRLEPVS